MTHISRRQFLQGSAGLAAVAAAPWVVRAAPVAPSKRIAMGCIGIGSQGAAHLKSLLGNAGVQVVAVCDVDKAILDGGKANAEQAYAAATRAGSFKGVAAYRDFREILARDDIDAIMVATPDHWHALIGIAAAKAGKDMYCEKPLTLTIREGRILADTVKRYGRILQVGSQQRSSYRFRFACELVRNGRIGTLKSIHVGQPGGKACPVQPAMPVPDGFNYDMWLGPAPFEPYTKMRCHYNFRFILDYSGGQMTNFGCHDLDIAQWALDMDDCGPVQCQGTADFPSDGLFNTATRVDLEYRYANGVRLTCKTGTAGVRFEGTEGWVYVNRGTLDAQPKSLLTSTISASETRLYDSRNHWGNFLECVRTRRQPICTAEIGHRTATMAHMGNIALQLGRKVRWDPKAERFVNDTEADRLISRPMRGSWTL